MNQPVYWSALLALALTMVAARLRHGAPLLRSRSTVLGPVRSAVAVLSVAALVFHCTAMFFAAWVNAVPGAQAPADAVRALGSVSSWAYCIPAVALLVVLRGTWWPAWVVLAAGLLGVGVTMFAGYSLNAHLAWIALTVIALAFHAAALVTVGRSTPVGSTRVGA